MKHLKLTAAEKARIQLARNLTFRKRQYADLISDPTSKIDDLTAVQLDIEMMQIELRKPLKK